MNYFIFTALATLLTIPGFAYQEQVSIVDTPPEIPAVLQRIAICESQGKDFDDNGRILKGGYNKYDIGKYQINVLYWGDLAKELGIDIYTPEGNEAMALEIYNRHGSAPWKWSKKCWDK